MSGRSPAASIASFIKSVSASPHLTGCSKAHKHHASTDSESTNTTRANVAGGFREAQRSQYVEGKNRRGEEGADDRPCPHRRRGLDRDLLDHQRSRRRA